jgi:hypothetical protein
MEQGFNVKTELEAGQAKARDCEQYQIGNKKEQNLDGDREVGPASCGLVYLWVCLSHLGFRG